MEKGRQQQTWEQNGGNGVCCKGKTLGVQVKKEQMALILHFLHNACQRDRINQEGEISNVTLTSRFRCRSAPFAFKRHLESRDQ